MSNDEPTTGNGNAEKLSAFRWTAVTEQFENEFKKEFVGFDKKVWMKIKFVWFWIDFILLPFPGSF